MTPDLFPVRGRNRYCGPAVVAALTGKTTDEAAFLLRQATGRGRILSVRPIELIGVLESLNFLVERFQLFDLKRDGPILKQWLQAFTAPGMGAFLVATVGHFQIVSRGVLACSRQQTPVHWKDIPDRRLTKRVRAVWMVHRLWSKPQSGYRPDLSPGFGGVPLQAGPVDYRRCPGEPQPA